MNVNAILIIITVPVTIVHKYFDCVDLNCDITADHTTAYNGISGVLFLFVVESNCKGLDHKFFIGLFVQL